MKPKKMKMHLDTKTGTLILAAVVILIVIFIAAFVFKSNPQGGGPAGPTAAQVGVSPTYAPQGQLAAGFPTDLILDGKAKVSQSYSIDYAAAGNQYTASWDSVMSVQALFDAYKSYLPLHGWTIPDGVAQIGKYGASLYGEQSGATANISIVPKGKGSHVVISYSK